MEKYDVITTPSARLDLDDAVAWYESKKEGLGIDFLLEFYDEFTYIENNPRIYQVVYGEFRRFQMKRFPYLAFYRIDDRTSYMRVVIVAVLHANSGPEKLKRRLGKDV